MKRRMLAFLLLLLFALTASAEAVSLYVDTDLIQTDVPAQIIQNRTMVPARFISEALGCSVTWDGTSQTAAVANRLNGEHIYITPTGKRYHFDGHCNGGTYIETTLADAMGRGLTACQKCAK